MAYADFDEIRASSQLRIVQDADDVLLTQWSDLAKDEIDSYCSRDFVFESGVAKTFHVTGPLIVLDKEVSNIVSGSSLDFSSGSDEGALDVASDLIILPPTNRQIRYRRIATGPNNYPINAKLVTIEADWGPAEVPGDVKRVFLGLIERLAARSNEDDVLQGHSVYLREDDGDEYTFDRGNGTLRALLRPEDREKLWKHKYHGRVVA